MLKIGGLLGWFCPFHFEKSDFELENLKKLDEKSDFFRKFA